MRERGTNKQTIATSLFKKWSEDKPAIDSEN